MKTIRLIGVTVAATLVLVAVGALAIRPLLSITGWGQSSTSSDTRVVAAIQRTEEVSLLSLGIQGILEKKQESTFMGVTLPGSDRATFLQYGFTAKVGIDGADVKIEPTGENQYRVSLPEFIFIGVDDPTFKVAAEDNGLLSWATPEIDPVEMVNQILTDEAKSQYISKNEELLKEQAADFYRSIIHAVDPEIQIEFAFEPMA